MIFGEFSPATPEITLLIMICVVLVVDLFVEDERRADHILANDRIACDNRVVGCGKRAISANVII